MGNIVFDYAAVAIPTLHRYDHFKRCVESLKENSFAQYTDLYIGLDFSSNDKYVTGREQIKEYLDEGIEGFANVYIYIHDRNYGAEGNIEFLIDRIRQKHDKFVVSEDDNEFAANYLEYINHMLERYSEDDSIVAISGYNYPMHVKKTEGDYYLSDAYFAAFGFASWISKFEAMQKYMTKEWIYKSYYNKKHMLKLRVKYPNQYCNFVKGMVGYTRSLLVNNTVWKMDLTYGLYMFFEGKYMVFPVISKVKNWGYDGSGVNCDIMKYDDNEPITHRNFRTDHQILDASGQIDNLHIVSKEDSDELIEKVNDFFYVPKIEVLKCSLAYKISRAVGLENMSKIWTITGRIKH